MQNNPNYTQNPLPGQQRQQPQGYPQNQPTGPYPTNPQQGQQTQQPQGYPQNQPAGQYPTNPLPGQQGYPPNQYNIPYLQSPQANSYGNQPGYSNQPNINYNYPTQGSYSYGQQNYPYGSNSTPQILNPQPGYQNVPQFGQQGVPSQVTGQGVYAPPYNQSFQNYPIPDQNFSKNNMQFPTCAPTPTLRPVLNSNPSADATMIFKAFKGLGSDSKAVMNILTHRSSAQIQKINEEYQNLYNKSLIARTKSEFLDPLEHIAVSLEYVGPERDAYLLKKAVKGLGTDECALINILCTRSSQQIKKISESYLKLFGKALLKDLQSDTSGNFLKLLSHLITVPRDESSVADPTLADKHVSELYTRSTFKMGAPETLISILGSSSYVQIKLTMQHFQRTTGQTLICWIKEYSDCNYERALISICDYVENPIRYFSNHLKSAITNLDFTAVIRVVCTRCEVDLANILQDYQLINKSQASTSILNVFGKNYRESVDALLMLMGCK